MCIWFSLYREVDHKLNGMMIGVVCTESEFVK